VATIINCHGVVIFSQVHFDLSKFGSCASFDKFILSVIKILYIVFKGAINESAAN